MTRGMQVYIAKGTHGLKTHIVVGLSEKRWSLCGILIPWSTRKYTWEPLYLPETGQTWHQKNAAAKGRGSPYPASNSPVNCRLCINALTGKEEPT